jgi:hypothetical protein
MAVMFSAPKAVSICTGIYKPGPTKLPRPEITNSDQIGEPIAPIIVLRRGHWKLDTDQRMHTLGGTLVA